MTERTGELGAYASKEHRCISSSDIAELVSGMLTAHGIAGKYEGRTGRQRLGATLKSEKASNVLTRSWAMLRERGRSTSRRNGRNGGRTKIRRRAGGSIER